MNVDNNVRLTSISIENWKCFKFKNFEFNERNNFYNQTNGFGKTSLIQAIIFCIYGKLPSGFKIKDLQNDESKKIRFTLNFIHQNNKYILEREIYPNGKKVCKFKKNDEEFCEYSVNQMNTISSEFFGESKYIDIIWSQAPLIYSDILKTSFVSSLISDCLKEEKEFADNLKITNLALSKEKKKIEQTLSSNVTEEDLNKYYEKAIAQKEILMKRLKNKTKSSIKDSEKSRAEKCLLAKNRRKEIEKQISTICSSEEIMEFKRLKSNERKNRQIIQVYSESVSSQISKYKKNFSSAELSKLLRISSETCKCPVCENDFKFDFTEKDLKSYVGKDDFDKANKELEALSNFDLNCIILSEEYNSLATDADMYENPEEVINKFNAQLDKDWEKLEKINESIQKCSKCKEFFKSLKNIDIEMKAIHKLLEISKEYENEAIKFYTNTVILRATRMLSEIDDKYIGLYFDKINGNYNVCMVSSDGMMRTRPVDSFSSGEKTVIALCLALAFKEVFVPNTILILDESLGSLDPDHLETCMNILSKVEYQTIVVAHNRK